MLAPRPKQRVEYDIDPTVPCYKYVGKKGFWTPEDELLGFGELFYMEGEPNTDLEPMNELARKNLNDFYDKLERFSAAKAKKDGKSFAPLPRNFNKEFELPSEDSRKVQLVKDGPGVPLLGAKRRGRPPKVRKLQSETLPDMGGPGHVSSVGVEPV